MKISTIVDNSPFRVLGVYGEFAVTSAKWKVCHFSTYASSKKTSRAGNTASLLRELKPMRERVKPRDINDMSALLQRDLNDARVANDLVPYLVRNTAAIGFFPAVLCALLPTGFLEACDTDGGTAPYPAPSDLGDGKSDFGSCWTLRLYPNDEGALSALGELCIDPSQTDIVVLDGQHRANAFRFVTDTFPEATKSDSIYHSFYKDVETVTSFDAELPVTIVWFQKTTEEVVNPRVISRRLFVDVNTNAKTVNQSRSILLDDLTPSSVFTNIFYTELAKYSFSANNLSLLHGAFDSEDDKNKSAVSLFTPVAIDYALRLFILGRDECDGLTYTVTRDRSKDHMNANRLLRFIDLLSAELVQQIDTDNILLSLHEPVVRIGIAQSAIKYAYRLLSEFTLFRAQIEASVALERAIIDEGWGNTTHKGVWEKVYCGGEGLYSSLRSVPSANGMSSYISGINEIEDKFKALRLRTLGERSRHLQIGRDAYLVASSTAGMTGLLMALSKCSEKSGWEFVDQGATVSCVDQFISLLNKTSNEKWLVILTEFKKGVVGGLEPKFWTHLRNIFLRVIESNSAGKFDFFKSNPERSPDVRFVISTFEDALANLRNTKGLEYLPSQTEVKQLRLQALTRLDKCLERCGLSKILPDDYQWPKAMLEQGAESDGEASEAEDEDENEDAYDQDQI